MRRYFLPSLQILFLVLLPMEHSAWGENIVLKAKVTNLEGKPVSGAKIFLYNSLNIRKPADFITPVTDKGGVVQIELPAGKYWGVARLKMDGLYGPLMPGDKHSGEPQELDAASGKALETIFIVADIREMAQKKRTDATGVARLKGRIVDSQGGGVANAYVFASRGEKVDELPEFISAWTDDDGSYALYLPAEGKFYVGCSTRYPLPAKDIKVKEVIITDGKLDIAMDIELKVQ